MTGYDCAIIGAGHNGLVAAAYLARAGRKVCVLERRDVLGGCASTEELYPGFRFNPAAYVLSLFPPAMIEELGLKQHGLAILPRDPSSFTPLPDGRSLLLGHDDAANLREIGKFSARDAENYPQYDAMLTRIADALEPLMLAPAPRLPPRLRDIGKWWLYRRAMKELGSQWRAAAELFVAPATRILRRYFESEPLLATVATDAIIGAMISPSTPGSAYILLHHVMGQAGGRRGIWAYVRGGIGGLADALEKVCLASPVEIRRNAEVVRINVRGTQASGVTLADGTEIGANVVASSIDGQQTLLRLLGAGHLPDEFAEQVRRLDYASASAKVNLALDGLPNFNTGSTPPEVALRGTIHLCPNLDYIERAFDDAKYGRPSQSPILEITMPSLVDDTLSPPGKHVASIFVQYAPYQLAAGPWDAAARDAFADRSIDVLAQYAPNIKDLILHRHVATPADLERTYGLTGGNIMQGAMSLDQLGPLRLDYRTPIRGLFLCGAATHPGGGIMGICGRNAAREILRG